MTGPSILHARAVRAGEATESLRARLGDEHAAMVALAATLLMQVRSLHALAHERDLPKDFDREEALCIGLNAMQENLLCLMSVVKIDLGDVSMLLPLLMKDMEDAASEMRAKRAAEDGGPH